MSVPRFARSALIALAAVPLAVKAPYLWRAWVSSPIDRAHLKLYGILSLCAVAVAVFLLRRMRGDCQRVWPPAVVRLLSLVAFALLYVVGVVRDVNAIQLIAGIGIVWSAGWLLFGRAAAGLFAPAAVLAVLAVPGTLYWMRNVSTAFALTPHDPFTPEFTVSSQKGMLGRAVPPSPGFTQFFRTSRANQYVYANPSNCVTVLAVEVGDDIHEIHPATHCLRSGGWRVESEEVVQVGHPNGGILEVDEAVVESFNGRMLVWIWYSSDTVSTGSFLHFRRMYSEQSRWRTYQVATALGAGADAIAVGRERMRRFLGLGAGR